MFVLNLEVAGLCEGDVPDDSNGVLYVLYAAGKICKVGWHRSNNTLSTHHASRCSLM